MPINTAPNILEYATVTSFENKEAEEEEEEEEEVVVVVVVELVDVFKRFSN